MIVNRGLAIYFFDDRIRISDKTMEELNNPKYIHLLVNREEKQLYIRPSEKRYNDTLKVVRHKENGGWCYRIYSRGFLKFLAYLIGLPYPSDSVWYDLEMQNDGKTALVNLNAYHIVPYRVE